MKLGTKIRNLRTEKNMSQVELAYKLDVAQTTISNIESNKTIPDFVLMEKIGEEFNVDMNYFLEKPQKINIKHNTGVAVGDNTVINVTTHQNIIEEILARLEISENKIR